jgi:enterochelin esterase family protein
MKKNLVLTAFVLLSISTYAQQALFGGQNIISPEIHADNTVTFRFFAPKAIKVQLTGEFLPTQMVETARGMSEMPGVVDLKEGEGGVWEYTTPRPVASDLYGYIFIVDGIRMTDPSNVYQVRDVATIQNILLIGGGKGDNYAVNDVPHGSVTKRWYNSPGLNTVRRLTVYTPPGYETSK